MVIIICINTNKVIYLQGIYILMHVRIRMNSFSSKIMDNDGNIRV